MIDSIRLLNSIKNYQPTSKQKESMDMAKQQMEINIQKKYRNSQINQKYRFPLFMTSQDMADGDGDFDDEYVYHFEQKENLHYQNTQHMASNRTTINISQCKREPLAQSSNLMNQTISISGNRHFRNKTTRLSLKVKKKDQTIKVRHITADQPFSKKQVNYHRRNQSDIPKGSIKTKLKIKKPNAKLNAHKKGDYLKTENNVNFGYFDHGYCAKDQKQMINQSFLFKTNQDSNTVILEQPSEDTEFFNSKNIQSLDENPNFPIPKQNFNVSGLKLAMRQSSNQAPRPKKGHRRTATQGQPEIKIKLFHCQKKDDYKQLKKAVNSSLDRANKLSCAKRLDQQQQPIRRLNRDRSTMSANSGRKGINICSKTKNNLGSKSKEKLISSSSAAVIKNISKIKLRDRKETHSRQSSSVSKTAKINSIMYNLKEEYKNKNKNSSSRTTGFQRTTGNHICIY